MTRLPEKTLFLIPVYNEEANINALIREIHAEFPGAPVCCVNDGSTDGTALALRHADCRVVHLPCNLGVGGAMQTAFRYAYENGYAYAIRLDGDGQHPPSECGTLVRRMREGNVDMVVGSRFLGDSGYTSDRWCRQIGIAGLRAMLGYACRRRITDPTSGFQMVNRAVMFYFAHQYPGDYPEPESLALLSRQGYRVEEVGVMFRPRRQGESSIRHWGTLYYVFKVGIALLVDRCRAVDPRYSRQSLERMLS